MGNLIEDAIRERQPRTDPSDLDIGKVWEAMRGSADNLRAKGLTVAVHNDYRMGGEPRTFWLMTWDTGQPSRNPVVRSFKGGGATDAEALDHIRAQFADASDNHKHAPLCPSNHYHGSGAVKMGIMMRDRG